MADLDDFFAKKDKKSKKGGKKSENILKTNDLFKALDNAAQDVPWDDQDGGSGRSKKQPQLGPVLSEVLNPEEASKWQDPVEEERQPDLTNLKFESLLSPEEGDDGDLDVNAEQAKPTKTWNVVETKKPRMISTGTKEDSKDFAPALVNASKENDVTQNPAAGDATRNKDEDGDVENEKAPPVSEVKPAVPETKPEQKPEPVEPKPQPVESKPAPVELTSETTANAVVEETPKDDKPKAYVPVHMRGKPAASPAPPAPAPVAPAAAAPASSASAGGEGVTQLAPVKWASLSGAAGAASGAAAPQAAGGKYVSPGQRNQAAQDSTSSSVNRPGPMKKPELDSEQDFPTLGGPAPRR